MLYFDGIYLVGEDIVELQSSSKTRMNLPDAQFFGDYKVTDEQGRQIGTWPCYKPTKYKRRKIAQGTYPNVEIITSEQLFVIVRSWIEKGFIKPETDDVKHFE